MVKRHPWGRVPVCGFVSHSGRMGYHIFIGSECCLLTINPTAPVVPFVSPVISEIKCAAKKNYPISTSLFTVRSLVEII